MTAGARNTYITVETREEVGRDPVYNTPKYGWVEHAGMWAEVQDILPSRSERLDDSISIARRPARVRVDYFDGIGITSEMRIVIEGRKPMQIVGGPAEKGRKAEWEMVCEELSTEGEAP